MRSERFPRIMTKLKRMHEQGKNVDFDVKQPWSSVFLYALENEDKWWNEHVVDPCRDCKYTHVSASDFIDGDVVAGSSASHVTTGSDTMAPMPTSIVDPNSSLKRFAQGPPADGGGGGKRRRGARGNVIAAGAIVPYHPPVHQPPRNTGDMSEHDGTKWVKNKSGKGFCPGFNAGTCYQCASDGLHCALNSSLVHQCDNCKKTGHGRSGCWQLVSPAAGKGDGASKGVGKAKKGGKGGGGKSGGKAKTMPWNKW